MEQQKKTYPLFKVHVDVDAAMAKVREVLESGYINEGTHVTEFQREVAKVLGAEGRLVLTNSCTSALTVALRLAGVRPGDHVVTTPMTCVATNTPIKTAGAEVIWADIDPMSGMLTHDTISKAITTSTRAVIFVAWAGNPGKMDEIAHLCKKRGVKLIVDAAHAFGAEYSGGSISDWADFTCYSFQAIKHVTTGDGGAIVCREQADSERAKCLKWFGLDRDRGKDEKGDWKGQQWDVDIAEAGYKFNMNNLAAAIGLSQLPHVQKILDGHRRNGEAYRTLFNETVLQPLTVSSVANSSSWVFTLLAPDSPDGSVRDKIVAKLNEEGIMAGLVHVPNDAYTCFQANRADLPGVREFGRRHFSIPCGWWISPDDAALIASRVIAVASSVRGNDAAP